MQCMKYLGSNLQNPFQKFHKNLFDFEKTKNFVEIPKTQVTKQEMHENEGQETYQVKKKLNKLEESLRKRLKVSERGLEVEKARQIERNEIRNRKRSLRSPSVNLDRSRGVENLLSFKGLNRSICRACVQGKRKLDGSRIYRGAIEGQKLS